ncbi:aldehyde dehydrogenase family protein [Gellertiella hungarica]|uniref:Acyl-CoA reductase-like NAD-dependent aldehyde dehydrogenase n=1 Tax=Gellertiella hungarica TaxID=1572859 RepID=A0A7W6J4X3_9HYPH|nr:aldehyde dehydrogenase family protein [Gellertiella hungarica]MBB4064843.1 acyl-CoA reductase-like NAD-dependent aldehyde dehydrogenase [Gellertiella hungarica]
MSNLDHRLAEARAEAAIAGLPRGHFIDGAFVAPLEGGEMESFDPGLGRPFASFANGSQADVDRAVQSARKAQKAWARTAPAERGRILRRIADLILEEGRRLALVEMFDAGKRLREAEGDVRSAARGFEYYAGAADKLEGAQIPVGEGYLAYTVQEPVGVVAQIIPWNYPLTSAVRGVAPALACGCSVVLKPAEQTPFTALLLAEICKRAGLPDGVFNVVTGTGARVGGPLTAHGDIDHITFTGSVGTGSRVMSEAARNITRVTLELGGKSPHVLLADCDLDRAIPDAMGAIFENAGQICSAGSRLIVERAIRDEVAERLSKAMAGLRTGHGLANLDVGAVNSAEQLARVEAHVEGARGRGNSIISGGTRLSPEDAPGGWYFAPTLIEAPDPADAIVQEEIFGPVLTLQVADDFDHAVALADGTGYALAGAIHTRDLTKAVRFAREVDAGQIYVNEYFAAPFEVPFGGNGKSGFGRAKGLEGLKTYCKLKSVTMKLV